METTRQHQAAISRFLDRLRRRERVQLAVAAGTRGVMALSFVLLCAAVALSGGVAPKAVALAVVTLGTIVLLLACVWPDRGRWRLSRSTAHQARQVEARLPGLRGRLITVIEPTSGRSSSALMARAAAHAHQATGLIGPSDVHPGRTVQRLTLAMVITLAVVGIIGRGLPVGPFDAVRVIFGASAASIRLPNSAVDATDEAELVGDITLRYVFPAYTGMEPREVPNSDGTIIAPPGTTVQIRARTGAAFDAAAVQVAGDEPVDAILRDGRDLSASLIVQASSTWRFLLFEGRDVSLSKDYVLRVEADTPPVVVISESGSLVVPVDAPLGLGWTVTDDYGVVKVSVELDAGEGPVQHVRREPISSRLELSGRERMTPRALGLSAGQTVILRVVALDNDQAGGGNRGESAPLTLEVLGPRGYGKNLARYHEKLLAAMLDPLADFLEEMVPPENTRVDLVRWAATASARFDPIRNVVEEQWGEARPSGIDGELVDAILEAAARLTRFTLITFDRETDAGGQQPVSADIDTFAVLHGLTIEKLETAIFIIDNMLREVGVSELARQARKVARSAEAIAERAQDKDDAGALASALDRLERQLDQLRRAASQLSDHALAEFTNSTLDQASGLISEIREAMAEGEMGAANEMMETLADQLAQLAESLSERQQRQAQAEDEISERFQALMADLEQLAVDQAALATELADAQDSFGSDFSERMAIWEQLDPLAAEFERVAAGTVTAVGDGRDWRGYSIRRLTELASLAAGTRDSVRARDAQGAARRVTEVGEDLPFTQRFVAREQVRAVRPQGVAAVGAGLRKVGGLQAQISRLLEALLAVPGESNPALIEATRALGEQQGGLQDRQRVLGQEVRTIEAALPVATGEASKAMSGAGVAMERARGALEQGVAVSGEGHQRRAVDLVRETAAHLQQSMEDQAQMQQSMAAMNGEKRAESGDEPGDSPSTIEPEIPAPELFKTAEDYRRALLEGMAGEVPEEFQALKKRFYEDLVRQ